MNNRWTVDEEKNLIKDISQMKTYNELSQKYNRSANALELRIKKIVYDNIVNNKSPQMIGGHLKLPVDKIKQYYYSYKEMLEKNGKPAINIDLDNNINGGMLDKKNINNSIKSMNNSIKSIDKNITNQTLQTLQTEDSRVVNMQEENKTFKQIIENIKMRHQLRKLLKAGKLSPEMKDVLKDILNN